MAHIKKEYKLLIGQQTSEELKLEIGSAWELPQEVSAEVRGRDMLTGLPKTIVITSEEVRRALDEPVNQIIDAIKSTLDKTPPELAADIMDRGIVLAGGGALLSGLEERLREETQMPVQLAESPLTCVAVGSGKSLEEFEAIHRSAKARQRNGRAPLAARSDAPSEPLDYDLPVPRQRTARLPVLDTSVRRSDGPPSRSGRAFRARLVAVALVLVSLGLITVYFRESSDGALHTAQRIGASRPHAVRGRRRARLASVPGRLGVRQRPASTPSPRTSSCASQVEALRQQVIQEQTAARENQRLRELLGYVGGPSFPQDYRAVAAQVVVPPAQPLPAGGRHRRRRGRRGRGQRPGRDRRRPRRARHRGDAERGEGAARHRPGQRRLRRRPLERCARSRRAGRERQLADSRPCRARTRSSRRATSSSRPAGRRGRLESLFPRGIPIGTVESVGQQDVDLYKRIQIAPLVDFDSLASVIVLRSSQAAKPTAGAKPAKKKKNKTTQR